MFYINKHLLKDFFLSLLIILFLSSGYTHESQNDHLLKPILYKHLAPRSIYSNISWDKESLKKVIPWADLIRDPARKEPEATDFYWLNNAEARLFFLTFLKKINGKNYKNKTEYEKDLLFKKMLMHAHTLAAQGSTGTHQYRKNVTPGKFRPFNTEFGMPLISLYEESYKVARIIDRFNLKNDLYIPFTSRYIDSQKFLILLTRVDITESHELINRLTAMQEKNSNIQNHLTALRKSSPVPLNRGTSHTYPDMKYSDQYLTAARKYLESFLNTTTPAEKIDSIAGFYHTLINIRPFEQINSSLFINMANALLRTQGLEGFSYHILDHIAMRMDCSDFKLYYREKVLESNLDKLSKDKLSTQLPENKPNKKRSDCFSITV